jgi:hypothetical protein
MATLTRPAPGSTFVRSVTALMTAEGDSGRAANIARARWPDDVAVAMHLKSAAIASDDILTPLGAADFVAWVTPRTILGRLGRLRRVPLSGRAVGVAMGTGAYAWVPQGGAIPVGRVVMEPAALEPAKVAGIHVVTDELLDFGTDAGEQAVRDNLADGLVGFLNGALVSDTAASAGLNPAGLRNGAATTASTGDVREDVTALVSEFENTDGLAIIMSEASAVALALAAPGALQGGMLAGVIPVVASSAAGDFLIGVRQPDIVMGDDGGLEIAVSRHGTLEMDTAPSHDATTPTPSELVSLWQSNSTGLRLIRTINWKATRTAAVHVITGADYAGGS